MTRLSGRHPLMLTTLPLIPPDGSHLLPPPPLLFPLAQKKLTNLVAEQSHIIIIIIINNILSYFNRWMAQENIFPNFLIQAQCRFFAILKRKCDPFAGEFIFVDWWEDIQDFLPCMWVRRVEDNLFGHCPWTLTPDLKPWRSTVAAHFHMSEFERGTEEMIRQGLRFSPVSIGS